MVERSPAVGVDDLERALCRGAVAHGGERHTVVGEAVLGFQIRQSVPQSAFASQSSHFLIATLGNLLVSAISRPQMGLSYEPNRS